MGIDETIQVRCSRCKAARGCFASAQKPTTTAKANRLRQSPITTTPTHNHQSKPLSASRIACLIVNGGTTIDGGRSNGGRQLGWAYRLSL